MSDMRTDAQLVTAYVAGDRSALAGIYDRFSGGLYDTAAAMLRDRHEAADAMQDVILIAAERMGQLREPERLKPWLYAILRNEVYRRSRKRGRALPTDFSAMGGPEMAAPRAPDAEGEAVSAAELAELVRSAACGLDERDQLVLELSVRQGLQGADLAAALGVSAEQSYTLVHRMRDRVDRSLGALVVARAGRKDCPDLADILRGWDGEFTVLVRKRVARHVEHCETCERTKKKAAPLALIGSGTAFAAPPDLRDKILAKAGRPGAAPRHAYTFDADGGFPRIVRHLRWPAIIFGGALAILLGIGGGALVSATTENSSAPPADSTVVPTTASATTVAAHETTEITVALPGTSSTTSPTTPGSLVVPTGVIDFGATEVSRGIALFNPGGTPVSFTVNGALSPFSVSSGGGTLQPGQHLTFTIGLNRAGLAEGDLTRTITFVANGMSSPLVLKGRVEHPPLVTLTDGPKGNVCITSAASVAITYTDESGIVRPISVLWSGPSSGSNQLKDRTDGSSYGLILMSNPNAIVGNFTYTITVTDTRGNTTTVGGSFQNCMR